MRGLCLSPALGPLGLGASACDRSGHGVNGPRSSAWDPRRRCSRNVPSVPCPQRIVCTSSVRDLAVKALLPCVLSFCGLSLFAPRSDSPRCSQALLFTKCPPTHLLVVFFLLNTLIPRRLASLRFAARTDRTAGPPTTHPAGRFLNLRFSHPPNTPEQQHGSPFWPRLSGLGRVPY